MQELLKTLFKTFIISIVLTIAINSMYYAVSKQNEDYGHVIPLIISGALFLNVMLLVMALPVLFLGYPKNWNNPTLRLLLYFTGPVLFVGTVLTMPTNTTDKIFYLSAGIIFIIVHSYYYYKLVKKTK